MKGEFGINSKSVLDEKALENSLFCKDSYVFATLVRVVALFTLFTSKVQSILLDSGFILEIPSFVFTKILPVKGSTFTS